jgi:hypothetical protein
MQVKFRDDESFKQNPVFVITDRKARNDQNRGLHTETNLQRQAELLAQVQSAYFRSRIFADINKKSLAVKVYKPTSADKISEAVQTLNKSLDGTGIRMTHKDTSITYHIDV